jgi:putative ABC transport system permease protein
MPIRRNDDDDMLREMREHQDLLTEEHVNAGLSPAEARRRALLRFGAGEAIQETARAQRPFAWLADLVQDLRHGARTLRSDLGFTMAAVATLALGIAACTAIFTVVNAVLLRPMPFPASDRLVLIRETLLPRFPDFDVSPQCVLAWRAQATGFSSIAAFHDGSYNLVDAGDPVRVSATRVTSNIFASLGVHPALGRDFVADEDVPDKSNVVVLAHGFWQRQFGGRADVVGRTIRLDGRAFTVVGVMPRGFVLDGPADLYTPAGYDPESGVHNIKAVARLRSGVTFEQALAQLAVVAARIARDNEGPTRDAGVNLVPLLQARTGDVRASLLALLGAVGLLLLIACANVANLQLARATTRARELVLRASLGATRARLVRQLLTESVLLALLGGGFGVLLARAGIGALLALAPDALPRAQEIGLDGRVLALACLLSLITGIVFGLAPALAATRAQLDQGLRTAGSSTGHDRRPRLLGGLVAAEIAVALVLLVGAGLLIRSFVRLQAVAPGFEPKGLTAMTLTLPDSKYPTGASQAAFAQHVVDQLAAIPGVASAGAVQGFPFAAKASPVFFRIGGRPVPPQPPATDVFVVGGDYFRAMGITLLRGRDFDARDTATAPRVTLINEAMARAMFAGEDPIGQRIAATSNENWHQIIGVVADVKHDRLDAAPTLQSYAPVAQSPNEWPELTFTVRTTVPVPAGLPAALRAAVLRVDSGQAITSVRPAGDWLMAAAARQRFTMMLFAVFSALALLLAAIGIYGVTSYAVAQRTAEIGIRMALGAQRRSILGLVARQAGPIIALGLMGGLLGARLLGGFLEALLFGIGAADPGTFAAIALLLTLVATLACAVPAARAAHVDPMRALRHE